MRYSVVRPTMSEGGGYARERGDVWGEVVPCVCHHVCITPVSLIARGAEGCLYLTGTRDDGRERQPSATLAVDETVE